MKKKQEFSAKIGKVVEKVMSMLRGEAHGRFIGR